MEEKKSFRQYMRALHRDIGFFVIGLTIIYSISGFVLVFRDNGFLRHETLIEKKLQPDAKEADLGMMLHIRSFHVLRTEGDTMYFQEGTYNKATGIAKYTDHVFPSVIERFNKLHMASSRSFNHWVSIILAVSLLFLAISSFWMYKPQTKLFRRGVVFAGIGLVVAIVFLFL